MRRNSLLYTKDRLVLLAKNIGVSLNTFKKYLKKCSDLGLLVPFNNSRKFQKLSVCIKTILPELNFKKFRFVRFFCKTLTTVKSIYEQIRYSVFVSHAKTQQHNINRKTAIQSLNSNRTTHSQMKLLKRIAKKQGCEVGSLVSLSKCNEEIVTGKYHLSNIIGCSPSTASKLLIRWHCREAIKREIVEVGIKCPVTHDHFDALKSLGYTHVLVSKDMSGFKCKIGSKVSIVRTTFDKHF